MIILYIYILNIVVNIVMIKKLIKLGFIKYTGAPDLLTCLLPILPTLIGGIELIDYYIKRDDSDLKKLSDYIFGKDKDETL